MECLYQRIVKHNHQGRADLQVFLSIKRYPHTQRLGILRSNSDLSFGFALLVFSDSFSGKDAGFLVCGGTLNITSSLPLTSPPPPAAATTTAAASRAGTATSSLMPLLASAKSVIHTLACNWEFSLQNNQISLKSFKERGLAGESGELSVLETNIYRLVMGGAGGRGWGAESLEAEFAQVWSVNVWWWHHWTQKAWVLGRGLHRKRVRLCLKIKEQIPLGTLGEREGQLVTDHRKQIIKNRNPSLWPLQIIPATKRYLNASGKQPWSLILSKKKKKSDLNCHQMVILSISHDATTCILSLQEWGLGKHKVPYW